MTLELDEIHTAGLMDFGAYQNGVLNGFGGMDISYDIYIYVYIYVYIYIYVCIYIFHVYIYIFICGKGNVYKSVLPLKQTNSRFQICC